MRTDVSGGGKDDLPSESEVDLGQGIPEKCDYPDPSDEKYLNEELEEYKAFLDKIKPGMTIESHMPKPPRTIEEAALYTHVLRKSNCFEVPTFFQSGPSMNQWNPRSSEDLVFPKYKRFVDYCKQAIDEYNKNEDTRYELKYLIKMCDNLYEFNVTFALTDPEHRQYVGRVRVELPYDPTRPPVIYPMTVTRGEYRAPHWTDPKGKEHKCVVNEKCREKLPELEKEWRSCAAVKSRMKDPIKLSVSELVARTPIDDKKRERFGVACLDVKRHLNHIRDFGVGLEKNWTGSEAIVSYPRYKIDFYRSLDFEEVVQELQAERPVIGVMKVELSFRDVKKGGIYDYESTENAIRELFGLHSVLIVGVLNDGQILVIKNSYGPEWGDRGYYRVTRSTFHPLKFCTIGKVIPELNPPPS